MNSVNLIGRIGKDIELKFLQSGSAVASFSIALDQSYVKDGQKVEKTSWIDITAFSKTAENVSRYFHRGSMIGISGELEQQTWKADDGSNRSKIVVKMNRFTFIDKKDNNQSNSHTNHNVNNQQQAPVVEYQNAQGKPTPPPTQMPQQPLPIDDDMQVPF